MCPDGFTLFGEACISLPVVGLVLVIIGWVAGYLSSLSVEKARQQAEKRALLDQLRREAIESAFRWIGLMEAATHLCAYLVTQYLYGSVNAKEFRELWPFHLLHQLEKTDLPTHLMAYLPEGTYARCIEIRYGLEQAFPNVLLLNKDNQELVTEARHDVYRNVERVKDLRKMLEAAHRATLD